MSSYISLGAGEAKAFHYKVHDNSGNNEERCQHVHVDGVRDDCFTEMQWELLKSWHTRAFDLSRRHKQASKFWGGLEGFFSLTLGVMPMAAAMCGSLDPETGSFIAAVFSFVTSAVLALSSRLQCAALSESHHFSSRRFGKFQQKVAELQLNRPCNLQRDGENPGCAAELINELSSDFKEVVHGAPLVSDGIFPTIPKQLMCDECCGGICVCFLLMFHNYHVYKKSEKGGGGFVQHSNNTQPDEEPLEPKCFPPDTEEVMLKSLAHCKKNWKACMKKAKRFQMLQRLTGTGLAFCTVFATAIYSSSSASPQASDEPTQQFIGMENETIPVPEVTQAESSLVLSDVGEMDYQVAGAIVSGISALLAFVEKFWQFGQQIQQLHTLSNHWSALSRDFQLALWMQPHRDPTVVTRLTEKLNSLISDIQDRQMFFIEDNFILESDIDRERDKMQVARGKEKLRIMQSTDLPKVDEEATTASLIGKGCSSCSQQGLSPEKVTDADVISADPVSSEMAPVKHEVAAGTSSTTPASDPYEPSTEQLPEGSV